MPAVTQNPIASRALYRKLLVFQLVIAVMLVLAVSLIGHGELTPGTATTVIGYVVAAGALGGLGYALFGLKPRLPPAPPGQDAARYLDSPNALGAALHLWIVCGGTGLMCWFAYGMTGAWPTGVMGLLALGAFVTLRPAALARS